MSDKGTPRKRRTWSAFGDVRRLPTEYEVVTHDTNWTTRQNRTSVFEQNPSSPANLWFLTYRDNSPLSVEQWNKFRDPDRVTYKSYVSNQAAEENKLDGILDEYSEAGSDAKLSESWVRTLGMLFTPTRFPMHGAQQIEAYIGHMAPSSYITNAAAFGAADLLRRVSVVSYRTRELQIARPDSGIGSREREIWENEPAWQGMRKLIETALLAYDWAEAFTALNLVVLPTLDEVLLNQFRQLARRNEDELTWLVLGVLMNDSERRQRWSTELASFAVRERPANADVFNGWINTWAPRVDEAVAQLAPLFETLPWHGVPADGVMAAGRQAREAMHVKAGLLPAGEAATA